MIDEAAAVAAVRDFLRAVGLDPEDPRLAETPERIAAAAREIFSGVGRDAVAALGAAGVMDAVAPGPVAVRGIPFSSMCEHHLLPFRGTVAIGYLPSERLVGIGDFDAMVRILSARPQIQERLGDEIAETVEIALAARGVIVLIDAEHSCMWARGERTVGASVRTIAARGVYREGEAGRDEGLTLVSR